MNRNISKSMMSYLKRAREHKEFLLKETKEFDRGKRHLANIMGVDSNEMTQEDVDNAITYLFPSGLFDPRARPVMKHPELLYKAQKDAQFDIEGRPYHYLFYTTKPNYYETLNQLSRIVRELNAYEDEQLARGLLNPPEEAKYPLSGRQWLSHLEMCDKFIEKLAEHDHQYLTQSLERLCQHPYSARAKSFLDDLSKPLPGQSLNLVLPELRKDETTGQIYTQMITRRREHEVEVKTVLNGSGIVDIDGKDILFFKTHYMRRSILFPLQLTGMIDKVDIYARFVRLPIFVGEGAIAGAIRYAVANSIAAFSDQETRERLRLAGLLTLDTRMKERKKFGQEGARRKYTWKKR